MKKIITLLLIVIFTCSLISCNNDTANAVAETTESLEDRIESKVRSRVLVEVKLSYNIQGIPTVTTYAYKVDENRYEVTGKVSVTDKYGDSYTGKYDAIVKYDPEIDSVSIIDIDVGTLYKD